MSKKPYLSPEMQEYQAKQKTQNKLLLQLSYPVIVRHLCHKTLNQFHWAL